MAIELENLFFINYKDRVEIDEDILLVAAWNAYVDMCKKGEICFNNNEKFFENSFKNAYDAAWAVSFSDRWNRNDKFVYFNMDGYLTSFTHWDDKNSPIDIDKIDISNLINNLKKRPVDNIPRAIHDALKEA